MTATQIATLPLGCGKSRPVKDAGAALLFCVARVQLPFGKRCRCIGSQLRRKVLRIQVVTIAINSDLDLVRETESLRRELR